MARVNSGSSSACVWLLLLVSLSSKAQTPYAHCSGMHAYEGGHYDPKAARMIEEKSRKKTHKEGKLNSELRVLERRGEGHMPVVAE